MCAIVGALKQSGSHWKRLIVVPPESSTERIHVSEYGDYRHALIANPKPVGEIALDTEFQLRYYCVNVESDKITFTLKAIMSQ